MKTITLFIVLIICLSFSSTKCIGKQNPKLVGSEWKEVLEDGQGELVFYWYRTTPLIYTENGSLAGIEYEIAESFRQFVETKYGVTLTANWINAAKFEDLVEDISKTKGGVFGMSGLSITEGRKELIQFTPPHLPDICVIVSSPNVEVEPTFTGFIESLEDLTAFTINKSTFEQKLLEIEEENDISLKFEYVSSNSDLIERLENSEDGFGYLDLPTFLIELNKGTPVRRQYFYPLKLPGLSFIYPKDSDWNEPIEAYFNGNQFQIDKGRIINKHLGKDIIGLMKRIALSADMGPEEEIIILTKERELQYEELLKRTEKMQEDQRLMNILVLIILVVAVIAAVFYTRFRVKLSANQALANKQAEIENTNLQLTELNEEKDRLIGVLAHDLRAPIGRISGIVDIIMHETGKEDNELLERIVKEAKKLNTLITKILDVEALENNRHNLNIEEVDAVLVINELINDYKARADEKEINLVTKFAHDQVLLMADKVYLSQALENLISNALKFSNQGTTVSIEVDDYNVIHVKDQGPGFTNEDKRKVFKKFQRLSAQPTGGEQSIGLGLITVRMFVELMKGELLFDSKENDGTTFHIKLPMATN